MSEKRDYVKEAYETFIKNAEGLDPTDPVKAVEAYFEKNATEELKERCKADGKDAKGCWKFIEAVARKVGGNCHIDPGAVYAMAMHYFEDVPVNWDRPSAAQPSMLKEAKVEGEGEAKETGQRDEPQKVKVKKPKAKKSKQGFFFDLMEVAE